MGDYYACHTRIKLKEETSQFIVSFFDSIFNDSYDTIDSEIKEKIEALGISIELVCSLAYGASAYHESYSVCEIIGPRHYEAFSSMKACPKEFLRSLLILGKYLDMKDGDVIHRYVWEGDPNEKLIWISQTLPSGPISICVSKGIEYNTDRYYLQDDRHPYHSEEGDDVYRPPMNRFKMLEKGLITDGGKMEYYSIPCEGDVPLDPKPILVLGDIPENALFQGKKSFSMVIETPNGVDTGEKIAALVKERVPTWDVKITPLTPSVTDFLQGWTALSQQYAESNGCDIYIQKHSAIGKTRLISGWGSVRSLNWCFKTIRHSKCHRDKVDARRYLAMCKKPNIVISSGFASPSKATAKFLESMTMVKNLVPTTTLHPVDRHGHRSTLGYPKNAESVSSVIMLDTEAVFDIPDLEKKDK